MANLALCGKTSKPPTPPMTMTIPGRTLSADFTPSRPPLGNADAGCATLAPTHVTHSTFRDQRTAVMALGIRWAKGDCNRSRCRAECAGVKPTDGTDGIPWETRPGPWA